METANLAVAAALLKVLAGVIDQLADLGAEVTDLKAACQTEATRIRARQAANEAEARAAMGVAPDPRG